MRISTALPFQIIDPAMIAQLARAADDSPPPAEPASARTPPGTPRKPAELVMAAGKWPFVPASHRQQDLHAVFAAFEPLREGWKSIPGRRLARGIAGRRQRTDSRRQQTPRPNRNEGGHPLVSGFEWRFAEQAATALSRVLEIPACSLRQRFRLRQRSSP